MYSSLTATGVAAAALDWVPALQTPVLIAVGFGLTVFVGGWIVAKLARGGARATGRRARKK